MVEASRTVENHTCGRIASTVAPMLSRARAALSGEAYEIFAGQSMLNAEDLGVILRHRPTPHDLARLRAQRTLIGLTHGPGFLYPSFQVDAARSRIRPEIAHRNRRLLLDHDEWSAMEWWLIEGRAVLPDHLFDVGSSAARR